MSIFVGLYCVPMIFSYIVVPFFGYVWIRQGLFWFLTYMIHPEPNLAPYVMVMVIPLGSSIQLTNRHCVVICSYETYEP